MCLCRPVYIQVTVISQLPCRPAGSEVIEMLMSSQEMLPAAEEGETDLSSLLLVLLHQRRFSTDWWKAKQQRQTAAFIASQPQFCRTAVTRLLPQRLTSLNLSNHSGPGFSPPWNPADIIIPTISHSSSCFHCHHSYLFVCVMINCTFCFQVNNYLCYWGIQISLTTQKYWKWQ